MNVKQFLLTQDELKNPQSWFLKAQPFRSTVKFLLQEHNFRVVDGAKIDDIALINDAIDTVPYLTCLGLELYMKGYLISQDSTVADVRKHNHRIWDMRKKCYETTKNVAFNNPDLKYLTDQLGPHILEDGGVRYPHKRNSVIPLDSCVITLDLMHDMLRAVIKD